MTSKKKHPEQEEIKLDHSDTNNPSPDDTSEPLESKDSSYIDQIEKLTKENNDIKDAALRAIAETENIKKRKDKEIADIKKYASSSLVQELVPILENLYRSISYFTEEQINDDKLKQLIDGIKMTQADFLKLLETQGVKRIVPLNGESFDHNLHQAISTIPTNGSQAPNTVVQTIQAGYVMNDRLLKPAMVIVSH